jgi:hypothetical protein
MDCSIIGSKKLAFGSISQPWLGCNAEFDLAIAQFENHNRLDLMLDKGVSSIRTAVAGFYLNSERIVRYFRAKHFKWVSHASRNTSTYVNHTPPKQGRSVASFVVRVGGQMRPQQMCTARWQKGLMLQRALWMALPHFTQPLRMVPLNPLTF